MRHDETWKLETEPRQDIQVSRLSQDRDMKTYAEEIVFNPRWNVLNGMSERHTDAGSYAAIYIRIEKLGEKTIV